MKKSEALSILGLSEGASEEEIKKAHRKLVIENHPDKFGQNQTAREQAEEKTKLINEARDVLLSGKWDPEYTTAGTPYGAPFSYNPYTQSRPNASGGTTLTAVTLLTSSQTGLSLKPVSFGPRGILFRVRKQPIHRAKILLHTRHRPVLFQPKREIRKIALKTQIPFHTAQAQNKAQVHVPLLTILLCRPFLDSRFIPNHQQSTNKSKTQKLFYSVMLSSLL